MTTANFYETYGGSGPESYERYFVPAIGAPLAADLVEHADLRPGERVLDVACGTGVVTRLAVERVGPTGTVAGLDLNGEMLSAARSLTAPGEAVTWHEAGAEAMPLPDESFDVVLCQLGLQFFEDRLAGVKEMCRVLAPGGRVHLSVPGPTPPIFAIMDAAVARHVDPEVASFVRLVFSLSDRDELARLLGDAGFDEVSVQVGRRTLRLPPPDEFLWQYVHSTPLAGAVAQADAATRAALERDVVAAWAPFTRDGALVLDLGMLTGAARR